MQAPQKQGCQTRPRAVYCGGYLLRYMHACCPDCMQLSETCANLCCAHLCEQLAQLHASEFVNRHNGLQVFFGRNLQPGQREKLHHVTSYLTLSSHFKHAFPMQMRSYGLDLHMLFNALQD